MCTCVLWTSSWSHLNTCTAIVIMATYLGPLTTTFTPPASCLSTTAFYRKYDEPAVKLLDNPDCFPSAYVSTGYYSPGSVCPSGYHGFTENDGAETSINCCPGFVIHKVFRIGYAMTNIDTVTSSSTVHGPVYAAHLIWIRLLSPMSLGTQPQTRRRSCMGQAQLYGRRPSK